jgi:hypothetical protein
MPVNRIPFWKEALRREFANDPYFLGGGGIALIELAPCNYANFQGVKKPRTYPIHRRVAFARW